MVLTGEENTKHWFVVLAFIYDTVSPEFIKERTGIKRANAYLLELTNEGYLVKEGFGRYTVNKEAFFKKLIEEIDVLLLEEEKEFLKDLLLNRPIIKALLRVTFDGSQIKTLLPLNPYKFLVVVFHNLAKVTLIESLKFSNNLTKEIESDEEIKAIKQKLASLIGTKGIEEIEKSVKSEITIGLLDKLIEQQLKNSNYTDALKVIHKHKKEFIDLIDYLSIDKGNLKILERIMEKIEKELEKDSIFGNFIQLNNVLGNLIVQILSVFKDSLKNEYKRITLEFYNNYFKKFEQNNQQSQ